MKELKIERPPRLKLTAKGSLKRTKEFDKRKEPFIAAIRKRRVQEFKFALVNLPSVLP